jgi:hypothetical protein
MVADHFNADDYYRAAIGRYAEATYLHQYGQTLGEDTQYYVLAVLLGGLAAECMFRAFDRRENPTGEFDSNHSIEYWSRKSPLLPDDPLVYTEYAKTLNRINSRWRNNHRYRDEKNMERWLRKEGFDRVVKGFIVKENCRVLLNAVGVVIKAGRGRWILSSKN